MADRDRDRQRSWTLHYYYAHTSTTGTNSWVFEKSPILEMEGETARSAILASMGLSLPASVGNNVLGETAANDSIRDSALSLHLDQ